MAAGRQREWEGQRRCRTDLQRVCTLGSWFPSVATPRSSILACIRSFPLAAKPNADPPFLSPICTTFICTGPPVFSLSTSSSPCPPQLLPSPHSPMVSPRMAALFALAVLLLCSGVRSEDVQGTITQVKVSELPSSENDAPPLIANATEGSSDTHSAVLASQALEPQDGPLVLVDLARADNQEMSNMTSALPPVADPVTESITLADTAVEEEKPSSPPVETETATVPDESDGDSQSLAATEEGGSLVPGFPTIGTSQDNTHGQGYGVLTYDASSAGGTPPVANEDDTSLAATQEDTSLAATQEGGTLVPGFPTIGSTQDNSQGQGYGVQTYTGTPPSADALAAFPDDDSSLANQDDTSLAATQEGGTLVPGFPTIGTTQDNSQGQGYGVQTYTGTPPAADSLAAFQDDESSLSNQDDTSLAATQEGGTLVPGFPTIGSTQDNSQGQGYGVQTYSGTPPVADSFATYQGDESDDTSLAATQEGGTLVPGFPTIGSSQDNTHGQGYGVQTYDASSARGDASAGDGDSLAAYQDDTSLAATQEGGTLVPGFPTIGSSQDNSQGQGYGVQTYDAASADADDEEDADPDTKLVLSSTRTYRPMPPKPAPAQAWRKGRCTYYGGMDAAGTMSGACGYGNLYASGYGVYTAALSAKLFNNGMACGACYEITCTGKAAPCKPGSIVVTTTNFCPPNPGLSPNNGGWCNPPNEHFDLSYPAFAKIADPRAGVAPLSFRRVPCTKQGGIRYTLNGNCNFNLVTITNVGGSGVVIEAYMKGDGMQWAPMSRNWGANWQCSRNYCKKGITIKIVTSDKKVSISRLAGPDWAFGKTYVGQQVK